MTQSEIWKSLNWKEWGIIILFYIRLVVWLWG